MHPTRTTTKLLLGVACAVSAVSGCVNVTPTPMQPATAPTTGVPPQHEARVGAGATPVEVQAPALEALEVLEGLGAVPGRSVQPTPSAASRQSAPRSAAGTAAEAAEGPSRAAPPVPDIPEPRLPAARASAGKGGRTDPLRPDAGVPRELMKELPVRPGDVCALGRRHGHWRPDSPEARICGGVHGG
ncbi:hypothetical protein ABZZ20_00205 [Streptomyces sp. NPDC006430]|uniref:hypothetical protein n=1 Tax=Streptomyces sp. NPDC006430 TaxID=3154299 RepID=UPI0033B677D9